MYYSSIKTIFIKCQPFLASTSRYGSINIARASSDSMPKRPLNSFQQFCGEYRATHSSAPGLVGLGKLWQSLEESERQKYYQKYAAQMAEYGTQKAVYISSLTAAEKASKKKERKTKEVITEIARLKSYKMGRPKRPPSAFHLFMSDLKSTLEFDEGSLRAVAMKLWVELEPAKKEKYILENRRQLERFSNEMRVWEKKMISEGNFDVIRKGTLQVRKKNKPTSPAGGKSKEEGAPKSTLSNSFAAKSAEEIDMPKSEQVIFKATENCRNSLSRTETPKPGSEQLQVDQDQKQSRETDTPKDFKEVTDSPQPDAASSFAFKFKKFFKI